MADKKVRDIAVDTDTKARLENAAWVNRTTASDLTRKIIQDAVDGVLDEAPVPKLSTGRGRLGVLVEDDLWEQFGEVAWRLRTSRVKLVQAGVQKLYGDIPIDRKEVRA